MVAGAETPAWYSETKDTYTLGNLFFYIMKEIKVSDTCAQAIEDLRKNGNANYNGELEGILDVLSDLNNMICFARESKEVGFFVDGLQRAQDKVLEYYGLLKQLTYDIDIQEFGSLTVEQPKE